MQAQNRGMVEFILQGDFITLGLFVILLLMSVMSWSVIALKSWNKRLEQQASSKFLAQFWQATHIDSVAPLALQCTQSTYARLTTTALTNYAHHQNIHSQSLLDSGDEAAYLTRTLRHALDEETAVQENGMTLLATVAATAPFVGLFGTVWGVYHALIKIGATGASTIDKIAAPVGEALIMTGLGLAVAIPAVVAYNIFTRKNRVLLTKLDGFAFELLSFIQFGQHKAQGK